MLIIERSLSHGRSGRMVVTDRQVGVVAVGLRQLAIHSATIVFPLLVDQVCIVEHDFLLRLALVRMLGRGLA